MKRKLLSLLLAAFFLFQHRVHANTFIVTSNADSGPGTLREAITLANANGISTTDSIHFNIADISRDGRTIILLSQLPPLTSNLIIDGSTQNGPAFGRSNAKIILLVNIPQPVVFTFFEIADASNIQFYGLYLLNTSIFEFGGGAVVDGISFIRSSNIIIGKAGKGNYFRGLYRAIYSPSYMAIDASDHLTVQSNIFNNDENGNTSIIFAPPSTIINPMEYAIYVGNTSNILIGGSSYTEANVTNARNILIQSNKSSGNGYLTISNNYFSIGASGIINYDSTGPRLKVDIRPFDPSSGTTDYTTTIRNNIFHGEIFLRGLTIPFSIQNNILFDNFTVIPQGDYRITIEQCNGGGMIGGDNAGESNTIYSTRSSFGNYNWLLDQGSIFNNSPGVSILKNVMYCNDYYYSSIYCLNFNLPYARIDSNTINRVSGKATPNTRIDVYLDDECSACEGRIYLGQTQSNADSSWVFTGDFNGTTVATSTDNTGSTSEFSQPYVNASNIQIKQPVCGQNNGSIRGFQLAGTWDNVEWHMLFFRDLYYIDSLVSTNIELTNIGPGTYYFVSKFEQSCKSSAYFYTLKDYSPKIDTTTVSLGQPACGQSNGWISGLRIIDGDFSYYHWIDNLGQIYPGTISGGIVSLNNLPAGQYRLIVTDTTVGCADSTRWYELINQAGPSLNTNSIQVIAATCNNSNGSITGITSNNVTGSPFIQWTDSLNNVVSNILNLLNQPAGKYKLKFKDQSGCDTIITSYYTIPATGRITIDTTGKIITKSGCTVNKGSIRNIHVTNADVLQWLNLATNVPAGNTIDIYNLPPGNYQLTATNATGCSAISPIITVTQSVFIPIGVTGTQARNAICGENNGILRISSFNNDSNYYSFRWIDSTTNQQLGTGTAIYSLGAGTYLLMATDSNGCEKQIFKGIIGAFPKPVFDLSKMKITDDKCSRTEGSITGIKVTGLFGPTTAYTWKNINNNVVGNTPDLLNVTGGQYYLTVTDGGFCTVQSPSFTITNTNDPGILLQYDDQIIPRNSTVTLTIKNFQPGTYFLYADPSCTQLIDQNTTGLFTIGPLTANADYYVKMVTGTCTSNITPIKITVVDKSFFAIASGFTPNNDGTNDRLNLSVIGYIDVEYFRIFNRNGEQVFFTKTINDGWDGKFKGIEQPTGAFVWLARGKDIHGNIITSKGTFLLIR